MTHSTDPGRRWFILGFTADDVVGGWQDSRLAEASVNAWRAAGRPDRFDIREAPGSGPHLTHWFVSEEAALILDGAPGSWRRFLIGEGAPPAAARPVLKLG
jgi:hypothetical protein